MHEEILKWLKVIETTFGVRILYAVELGSRAWGFESPTSDYDVRVIYAECPEVYFGLPGEHRRLHPMRLRELRKHPTFSELPTNIDFDGWEFKKALGYVASGKPTLIEWLNSDIVYVDGLLPSEARCWLSSAFPSRLRNVLRKWCYQSIDLQAVLDHYIGLLAQIHTKSIKKQGLSDDKTVLHMLRCVGAVGFLLKHQYAASPIDLPIRVDALEDSVWFLLSKLPAEYVGLTETEFKEAFAESLRLRKEGALAAVRVTGLVNLQWGGIISTLYGSEALVGSRTQEEIDVFRERFNHFVIKEFKALLSL